MTEPVRIDGESMSGVDRFPATKGCEPTNGSPDYREWLVCALVTANLCLLPWAYGGVDVWSQVTSAMLAACAFGVALLPERHSAGAGNSTDRFARWRRLRRFPLFWIGLALLAYIGLQGLNPRLEYQENRVAWWLDPIAHWGWLPSGIDAPFSKQNGLRFALVWGTCWMAGCAVWVGMRRRSMILGLLTVLCVNGFLFAAFGLLQRASGAREIYGVRPAFEYFFAAIIYKNHAAAFFSLVGAVALGLTVRTFQRPRLRVARSGVTILFSLFTVTIVLALVLSFSLSVLLLFGLVIGSAMIGVLRRSKNAATVTSAKGPVLVGLAVLIGFTIALGGTLASAEMQTRIQRLAAGEAGHSLRFRFLAAQRGWEMFMDRPFFGWGAGCFRYGFTKYQRQEPDLARWQGFELQWEHVHNDWLELLIEVGCVGTLFVGLALAYGMREVVRLRLWRTPAICPMLGGLLALGIQALMDFPLQLPAVAMLASVLLPLLIRWGELENQKSLVL